MSDRPRIFYFAYDHQRPTGGQKSVYRHVDHLNRNGFDAWILHLQENYRLSWFANQTRVLGPQRFGQLFRSGLDVLALPEDLGRGLATFPGRKVILNQGPYLGFLAYGLDAPRPYPYLSKDVEAVIVKSEHSRDYLRFAFPNQRVLRVYDGVDGARFPLRPPEGKRRLIALPPGKNPVDLAQVYNLACARAQQGLNGLADWEWVQVEGQSEAEVVRILGEAALFLFLSTIEGFGLLPLEAMLSGALVLAYQIEPLTEYLSPAQALLAPRGDVVEVVRQLEAAALLLRGRPDEWRARAQRARALAERFSLVREEESVVRAWGEILGGRPAG
jgi:hypothetical protein